MTIVDENNDLFLFEFKRKFENDAQNIIKKNLNCHLINITIIVKHEKFVINVKNICNMTKKITIDKTIDRLKIYEKKLNDEIELHCRYFRYIDDKKFSEMIVQRKTIVVVQIVVANSQKKNVSNDHIVISQLFLKIEIRDFFVTNFFEII